MSRKSRIISSTGVYHIILRSINQQQLFEDDEDYLKFIYVLSDVKEKYPFDLYAYCLMGNHIHLLMSTQGGSLSSIFQSFGSRFVYWYNIKYQRFGHLFQERFISKPVETANYFLYVLQYIHLNPVRAELCRFPTDYRWSSAQAYYGANNPLISKEVAANIAGSTEALQQYLHATASTLFNDISAKVKPLPDSEAMKLIKSISGCSNPSEVQHLSKTKRNELIISLLKKGLRVTQIARLCGVSRTTVNRLTKK